MTRASDAFARMHLRLFAHYGEEAVLRGAEPTTVVVSDNVELIGEDGLVAQVVTTATFKAADAPRPGDALTARGQPWEIDRTLRGDANIIECVLRPDPPAP